MIHLSILRPGTDSVKAPQRRAILDASGVPSGERLLRRPLRQTSRSLLRGLRYLLLAIFLFTPLPNRARSAALCLPFRTVRSMILVEGEINGDPVTLLMDTGSTKTIISAKSYRGTYFPLHTAQRTNKTAGIVGESVSVRLDLKLANHRWVGQTVSIMNLGDLNRLLGAQFDGLLEQ